MFIENIVCSVSYVDISCYNYEVDEVSFFVYVNKEGDLLIFFLF